VYMYVSIYVSCAFALFVVVLMSLFLEFLCPVQMLKLIS